VDVTYINPFLSAIAEFFSQTLEQDLEIGSLRIKDNSKSEYSISGVIGLSGSARGFIAISYPKLLAVKVVSTFLAEEVDEFSPYVADGIGEITNIVAGNAQKYTSGIRLELSLPNVVVGANHRIRGTSGAPVITVPLKCQWGEFELDVSFTNS
jgi:chemotaxis protein CheX